MIHSGTLNKGQFSLAVFCDTMLEIKYNYIIIWMCKNRNGVCVCILQVCPVEFNHQDVALQ